MSAHSPKRPLLGCSTFSPRSIINEAMTKTPDNLRDTIRRRVKFWLAASPFNLLEHPASNAVWRITIEDESGLKMDLAQIVGAPQDMTVIQASITVGPGYQNTLGQMEASERAHFLRNIQFRLILMGVEFQGIIDPLERIVVQHFYCFDGVTKDSFFQKLSLVRRAAFAVALTLDQLHGDNGTSPEQLGNQEYIIN